MKKTDKTYIKPQTDVLQLKAVQLLQEFSGTLDAGEEIEDPDDFGSRGGFWDTDYGTDYDY